MNFLERLDALMEKRGISRAALARETGIPYTTIVGFYTKGYDNMKLSNLRRLADYFGVSMEFLCGGEEADTFAQELSGKIMGLSRKGRTLAQNFVNNLLQYEQEEDEEEAPAPLTYIREYQTPAAAGYSSPVLDEDYLLLPRDSSVPAAADFAVRIAGDSMEPYIADGSRVFVSQRSDLLDGDVGVFFVDGDMKCKQYCADSFGNVYLFSLNRARADADVTVLASSGTTICCFGKVLLNKRPPLPAD